MKRSLALALAAACVLGCQKQPSADQVAARVNTAVLTQQDFNEALPPGMADIPTAGKEDFVRRWINSELLYQEAKRRGLHKDPKIVKQLKDIEREMLANNLLQKEIIEKQAVNEADAKAYFDKHQEEYQVEVRLSQILVNSQDQAAQIKAALDKGADFGKLAREKSLDTLTRSRGGDLVAYIPRGSGNLPLDFEETVFVLPAGGISAPIKLPDGYRIIKVAERRPALDRVKFEDVRDGLMYALNMARQKQSFEALVEQLKSKAKVESHPERLK